MRIIIALHQYFPEYSAGTEALAHSTAKALVARGHEVMVVAGTPVSTLRKDDQRFELSSYESIPVLRFFHQLVPMAGQADVVRMEYDSAIVARRFTSLLVEWTPDVVHFFNFARISSSPMECCLKAGIPYFYTATDFWSVCPTAQLRLADGAACEGADRGAVNCMQHIAALKLRAGGVSLWAAERLLPAAALIARSPLARISRQLRMVRSAGEREAVVMQRLNSAQAVLVPTVHMADVLMARGVSSSVVQHVRYGIDLSFQRYPRTRSSGRALQVGFIGTLAWHKGAHVLLEAMKVLKKENMAVNIFGDTGPFPGYVDRLRELASDDDRIRFRGTFGREETGRVFAELDVLVVPSTWDENAPLVIFAAQACGCPVIAARQLGMKDAVREGEDGLLFDPSDAAQLARILAKLTADRSLVDDLSDGCRPPRSIDDYVDDLEDFYQMNGESGVRVDG